MVPRRNERFVELEEDGVALNRTALLFHVVRLKYALPADLNDDGAFPRSEKVRHIRGNDYEAASGIGLQLTLVEAVSDPQVPRTFDHRDDFVIWMSMGEDARSAGDFGPVDPSPPLLESPRRYALCLPSV